MSLLIVLEVVSCKFEKNVVAVVLLIFEGPKKRKISKLISFAVLKRMFCKCVSLCVFVYVGVCVLVYFLYFKQYFVMNFLSIFWHHS